MIGDFFTKPNQGALFVKFRDQIMGVEEARDPGPGKAEGSNKKQNKKKINQEKPGSHTTRNMAPSRKKASGSTGVC